MTGVQAAEAASLKFSPTSKTVNQGDTFQVQVNVDAGSEEVSGTDSYVLYDASKFTATSVTEGTYFPYVTSNIASGKVSIWGVVTDPATSRTGSGTLATITFTVLQNASSANLTFYCDLNANDTSKIVKNDINATNIIVCSANDTAVITVNGGGGGG
ncbi:MAG: Cohesin domain, partial [Candidatus Parcubacteria bacterium]